MSRRCHDDEKKARVWPDYREQIVELFRARSSAESLSREFGCSAQAMIRNWVHQADLEPGPRDDGLAMAQRDEPRRLQRENAQLREKREIPKKAAAWFPRERAR